MSEDRRKDLRDVLDEFEHYFQGFQKEIEDAVKNPRRIRRFDEPLDD